MKSAPFQIGAAFAVLVGLAVVAFEGEDIAQAMGVVEEEPVLVFTISRPKALDSFRRVIASDRIVHENEHGLALEGGRVYVDSLESAGGLIKSAGWVDHPIEIVGLGMDEEEAEAESGAQGMSDEERLARLRSLVHKPTLSRGEQLFVLKAMNDGIEI